MLDCMQYLRTRQKGMGKGRFCHMLARKLCKSLNKVFILYKVSLRPFWRFVLTKREAYKRKYISCHIMEGEKKKHFQVKHLHPSEDASQICQLWYIRLLPLFSIFNLWVVKHLKKKKKNLLKATQLYLESLMGAMDRPRSILRKRLRKPD